jgi:hypothetical protein
MVQLRDGVPGQESMQTGPECGSEGTQSRRMSTC